MCKYFQNTIVEKIVVYLFVLLLDFTFYFILS